MEWFEIEKQKPPENRLIIGVNVRNHDVGIYCVNGPTDFADLKRITEITHWMLLPEPPTVIELKEPSERLS